MISFGGSLRKGEPRTGQPSLLSSRDEPASSVASDGTTISREALRRYSAYLAFATKSFHRQALFIRADKLLLMREFSQVVKPYYTFAPRNRVHACLLWYRMRGPRRKKQHWWKRTRSWAIGGRRLPSCFLEGRTTA